MFVCALQPITHTEIATWHLKDDSNLFSDIQQMLKITPRLLVLWRPDVKRYSGYLLTEVPATQPADESAVCTILPSIIPPVALATGAIIREWQTDINNSKQPLAKASDAYACGAALTMSVGQPWAASNGLPVFSGTILTNKAQVSVGMLQGTAVVVMAFSTSQSSLPNQCCCCCCCFWCHLLHTVLLAYKSVCSRYHVAVAAAAAAAVVVC